ncbi:unnamed protein product [Caenorhabditis bovis]|uniref:Zinc transporter ZIP13 n=1 Tax=Caenorhabditis bovis TaxID=2654633 RepID=A0A8S1ED02_9PELO|nr:unnamed protein product [Caenorhabditis bovis]
MFWFILLSSCIAIHAQQGMMLDLHPAAGPDLFPVLTPEMEKLTNEFDEFLGESLIDPEGKPIIEPNKIHIMVKEEDRRREAMEIQRILDEQQNEEKKVTAETWFATLIGCCMVVSCGVIPAFLLPENMNQFLASIGQRKLNLLLSFAVGSLLGDVFLHLLPESFENNINKISVGLWILGGYLIFSLIEKVGASTEEGSHQLCAYMNLAANIVDNFAHGLAVGGSFLVSTKLGVMTTISILLHEIPHEISDFAILLRADYERADAIKAQLVTATAGVFGSCVALGLHTSDVSVIETLLPFTAGGFLNIALTQLLPELNEERSAVQNLKQLVMVGCGIMSMTLLNSFNF